VASDGDHVGIFPESSVMSASSRIRRAAAGRFPGIFRIRVVIAAPISVDDESGVGRRAPAHDDG
jgi:hypothetical protein